MSGHNIDGEELSAVSADVMATLDEDGDGNITKEEFIKHALKRNYMKQLCLILIKEETDRLS